MHGLNSIQDPSKRRDDDTLVAVATLVTEGRIPGPSPNGNTQHKDFYEGPHCNNLIGIDQTHICDIDHPLCEKFRENRDIILKTFKKGDPICVEVLLTCACKKIGSTVAGDLEDVILLEQWFFCAYPNRASVIAQFNVSQLLSAIRSQLYFSQITAWLVTQDKSSPISVDNFRYRISIPEDLVTPLTFSLSASRHEFPTSDLGSGTTLTVSFLSAPRLPSRPEFHCKTCTAKRQPDATFLVKEMELKNELLDDRMQTSCTVKGKHCCEDMEDHKAKEKVYESGCSTKSLELRVKRPHTDNTNVNFLDEDIEHARMNVEMYTGRPQERCHNANIDLRTVQDKGQLLLDAIERSGQRSSHNNVQKNLPKLSECDNFYCDTSESDKLFSCKEKYSFNNGVNHCDNHSKRVRKMRDLCDSRLSNAICASTGAHKKITFNEEEALPSGKTLPKLIYPADRHDHIKVKRNLGNTTPAVFDNRTGLPLSSSPAPIRKGQTRFDFDSTLDSVSAIKSALFSSSFSTDEESENEGGIVSPRSPEIYEGPKKELYQGTCRQKGRPTGLLGTFEESVLNGRLEPVSTVHGFTAEVGANGSFVPKHLFVPVTTFFYAFGDQDRVSAPYMGHIKLSKKGYNVPKGGTVQVTLFNPLGTVVKMFVVPYDFSDMPPNSQTFIRQRTYYMPSDASEEKPGLVPKWLRFVIHIRFISSKSGKIYLHSDVRMIILRKSDMDTATAHDIEMNYELRSFVETPLNPVYSPRK
ncbi:atos homolog protein A [Euwallacea fornicatus]|uniref:atos homolog protein A n=1 Tax=Euwallacea fornicatus TaxID=995702 RepID=UPI00338FF3A2